MNDSQVIRLGHSIQAFLQKHKMECAKPKDIMPWLIEKGYFKNDHRAGLPLRNLLRQLDDENKLYLLPNLKVERKEVNRFWSFVLLVD
jgi:hypothetical protein